MKVLWTKKAEKNLSKILDHTILIRFAVSKLSEFPNMGRLIGGHYEKRQLVISGNVIVYEIVLSSNPHIIIRNIRPRRTASN